MDVRDLREMMQLPFKGAATKQTGKTPPFVYVINEFSFENDFFYERKSNHDTVMHITLTCGALNLSITPQMVEDCNLLCVMFQNYFLSKDLKQYRPHRRPIVLDSK